MAIDPKSPLNPKTGRLSSFASSFDHKSSSEIPNQFKDTNSNNNGASKITHYSYESIKRMIEEISSDKKPSHGFHTDTGYIIHNLVFSIMSMLAFVFFVFGWIRGFVIAKGFWSTFFCIVPFWAWYLSFEEMIGLLAQHLFNK